MHGTSYRRMGEFVETHVRPRFGGESIRVLDVGSQDKSKDGSGTYKPLFDAPEWEYLGLDMEGGHNVDVLVRDPYFWTEIPEDAFEVVISGQCLEHVEFPWLTMVQVARKLKPHGLVCVIAPGTLGHEHRYPVDCYRYLPDGMRALGRWAGLECLSAEFVSERSMWRDVCAIYTKYPEGGPRLASIDH